MIHRKIHYCWFGRKPLPDDAVRYIRSWRDCCPGYEIKEWNEDNFPIDSFPYAREAYDAGKYAFVSDVARLYALATEGGVYFDTDVEVLKSFDPLLDHVAFTGFEDAGHITTGVIGSEAGGRFVFECLDAYRTRRFVKSDGTFDTTTNVAVITAYMAGKGLRFDDSFQDFSGLVAVYPREYFCPRDSYAYARGIAHLTSNTYAIHYFAGTWQIRNTPEYKRLRRKYKVIPYFIRKKLILALMGEKRTGFFAGVLRLFGHPSQRLQ